TRDRGKYHCMAENKYGKVLSRSVALGFGFIGEFNKNRAGDSGKEFWGKSVSCDPPQFNPAVHYFWVRNAFPDFVQEDPRVAASHRRAAQGPYFHLLVEPASSGQKLLFPNNFPKSFPEAPLAGNDVRLECIAYGYPVPKYNWTRLGGPMPAGAQISSHGRVLLLPRVRVEDLGEYVCIASADQDSIRKGVTLTIQVEQAAPAAAVKLMRNCLLHQFCQLFSVKYCVFVLKQCLSSPSPLEHQVADEGSRLTWTCEAFGIPEVVYHWYRNGEMLNTESSDDMRARYKVRVGYPAFMPPSVCLPARIQI
ncbi:hypothetical protein MTO96_047343, partial [Rhipicephalus appendiculatus]